MLLGIVVKILIMNFGENTCGSEGKKGAPSVEGGEKRW